MTARLAASGHAAAAAATATRLWRRRPCGGGHVAAGLEAVAVAGRAEIGRELARRSGGGGGHGHEAAATAAATAGMQWRRWPSGGGKAGGGHVAEAWVRRRWRETLAGMPENGREESSRAICVAAGGATVLTLARAARVTGVARETVVERTRGAPPRQLICCITHAND